MKTKCDFILLILNCKKYREKAILQKNTWLKTLPTNMKYYHVIGDKEKCGNNDIIIDETENIIYTNTLDDYNSLPSKVITALKGIHSTFDFKYVFKTDDDQELVVEDLFICIQQELLKNAIQYRGSKYEIHYGGLIRWVPTHISNYCDVHACLPRYLILSATHYANGRFYLLSKSAVEDLLTKKKDIEKQIIEDHAIGLFLDPILKTKVLHINSKLAFKDVQ